MHKWSLQCGELLYLSRVVGIWVSTVVIFSILPSLNLSYLTTTVRQMAVVTESICFRNTSMGMRTHLLAGSFLLLRGGANLFPFSAL